MEHYDPDDFDFDEKAVEEPVSMMDEEDPALLLLSDQLMEEDDDESEIYEMAEDDETAIEIETNNYKNYEEEDFIAGTPGDEEFEDEEEGLVQENPFEPVYPASAALLSSDSLDKGIVLEAVSLDNILPAGSRRRRN